MWISPKLFLDQLNAWINGLFLFIIKRTSSHDFLTRETEFESSSDKSSLILPIMALGRSVLGEYFFLAIFTQRNSWRERFWIFGRAPHLFLPGKIELIESFLILSNSFWLKQIFNILMFLRTGPNLFICVLVMFLICVFQNERFNWFLWFLASSINNNGTLRKCYLFSCRYKSLWDIGIYLKPHFYTKNVNNSEIPRQIFP